MTDTDIVVRVRALANRPLPDPYSFLPRFDLDQSAAALRAVRLDESANCAGGGLCDACDRDGTAQFSRPYLSCTL
jgi:hypothetical protein